MKNIFLGLFLLQTIFVSFILSDEVEVVDVVFKSPKVPDNAYFADTIQPNSIGKKWILSQAKKDGISSEISKYDGQWSIEVPSTSAVKEDYALVLQSKARHHAIATKLDRPIKFDKDELVIQYEAKFQNGMECGGAYIKLLSSSREKELSKFFDKTPFTIMFGPDKCGLESKIHFIFRHKNPLTNEYEEKFVKSNKKDIADIYTNKKSHLFTLVLRKDNTFEIYVDQHLSISGDLLNDFEPPVNPPNEIDDPNDKKPEDWDDREKIADETATKPEDWDENAPEFIIDEKAEKPIGWLENEPEMINDPDAKKPEDWDSSIDGEWEPPKISNPVCKDVDGCGEWKKPRIHNPQYKGKWSAPMISNPNYKGVWSPRKIPNPNYFEDKSPFTNLNEIDALGLELWSMTEGVAFDNFLIVDSLHEANRFADETWKVKREAEEKIDPSTQSIIDYAKEVFTEKPWLIAVVIGCVVLFFALLFYCLCRGGSDDDDEDEPLLVDGKGDDKAENQYSPAGAAAALSKNKNASKSKDSDGESDDVDYDKNNEDASKSTDDKSSSNNDEDEQEEEEPVSNKKESEDKVRKRRVRKD